MEELKIETKVCSKCNKEKELTEFYSQKFKRVNGEIKINYQPKCKECLSKEYQENKAERDKYRLEHARKYPEKRRMSAKKSMKKKPDKYKNIQRDWRQNNPDKVKEYNEKYQKEKKFNFTNYQWENCKEYFNYCCAYCGISEEEAKQIYNKSLHKEHAINKGVNELSNCLPVCTSCNSKKYLNDYTEWYVQYNPLYSEERFNLIEKWLNEDHKKFI